VRIPLVVVTGIDRVAMDSTLLSLQWDLPRAVVVSHSIDPVLQTLTRTVSDTHGTVESAHIDLEHACVGCALREDLLPTIERLARDRRWQTIVASLPVGAEAEHLSHAITRDPQVARRVKLTAVIATVATTATVDDYLGSSWLRDRGLHSGPDDDRGLGQAVCGQIEYADIVVAPDQPDPEVWDLLQALHRPTAQALIGIETIDTQALLQQRHNAQDAYAWRMPRSFQPVPLLRADHAWRLDLVSPLACDPDSFLEQLNVLGEGPYRSRGCFWVPSRASTANLWDGAGGHVSIGHHSRWGSATPLTRIVVTGVGEAPENFPLAFASMLLSDGEALLRNSGQHMTEDGLEPWLGGISRAS
jgi:G3E family GTPase